MANLMDIEDLSRYFKIEKQTLYNWLNKKKVPGIKVGHVWRFDKSAIDDWLRSHTVKTQKGTKSEGKD